MAEFIRLKFALRPLPSLPHISLYTAQAGTGLNRYLRSRNAETAAPYWAWPWAGGLALAHYIANHPGLVSGKCVLDLGAGSGLVAIAAALAGARRVMASEIDSHATVAIRLNAEANGVVVETVSGDATQGPLPDVDLILAGDVFYAPEVAASTLDFLERCQAAGIQVLIGDPGRTDLPLDRLQLVASYAVTDFGQAPGRATSSSGVYTLKVAPHSMP